jgi:hypothetical protein
MTSALFFAFFAVNLSKTSHFRLRYKIIAVSLHAKNSGFTI